MNEKAAKSILIVEDESIVALDLQQQLMDYGYDAWAIADSAEAAIACASERCPDLVLMDIRIRGRRDGIETATVLKERFGVPVVFLTAHADEATLDRAKRTMPHGYLQKPVKPDALHSVIEVALYTHAMEQRARARERWFATTLRSIADAVISVDLAGLVTYMNPAAEVLTGTQAVDAIGKPMREVMHLVGLPATELPVMTAMRAGQPVELQEGNLLNATSGVTHVINDSAAPVLDDDERMLGAVMVFRDVTQQKKLQRQVELSDRLSSLGTLAAGVAHEINNPLAAVLSNTQFLSATVQGLRADIDTRPVQELRAQLDELADSLVDIESAANRIKRIVADLKTFSHPEQQHQETVDVVRCLQWALRTTAHEFRQRARLITVFHDVPAVLADEMKLGQVLINVLVNAAHAIAPGRLEHNTVTVMASLDVDGRVLIEVKDTGVGMTEAVRKKIFEPFFTTKGPGVGTGLGLSISHGLVVAMGGSVEIDSTVDVGTTVRVLLAASLAPVKAAADAAVAGIVERPSRVARILIIDDETLVLRSLTRLLRDHEIVCVERAREALALLDSGQHFDLILSDITMPSMTGMDFYEQLLARRPADARRLVFLSGGAITSRTEDFLASVPNPRLEKPFDNGSLVSLVNRLLAEAA